MAGSLRLTREQLAIITGGDPRAIKAFEDFFATLNNLGAHAATHEPGGADPLTADAGAAIGSLRTLGTGAAQAAAGNHNHKLDDLAAPDDNTDLNASAAAHGLLPKLSGVAADALRGDGTWSDLSLPVYDSGWINRSDWTNVHLGSNATKNTDSNVTHNLNAPLSKLLVKVLISTDGTDANSFEVHSGRDTNNATPLAFGYQVNQVDLNSIVVQTGAEGFTSLSTAGAETVIDAEDWYYKVRVYSLG